MREFKVGDLVHMFYLHDSSKNAHRRVVIGLSGAISYKLQLEGTERERYDRGDPYNGCEILLASPHMIIESEQFGIHPGYVLRYQELRKERDELGLEAFLRKYGC
jgi:hypothetical protein